MTRAPGARRPPARPDGPTASTPGPARRWRRAWSHAWPCDRPPPSPRASSRAPVAARASARSDRVRLLRERWSIVVDLSQRRATLLRAGRRYASFPVAVGQPASPTPPGRYGVTDRLTTGGAGSPYGCCVLALTGHQPDVPQDWPGGDRLAIHGTDAPSSIGRAASRGCLRAPERAMRLLIARVPLGAQVVVRS